MVKREDVVITDDEIVELFFKRDENAIKELSNKYNRYCHSIAFKILNNTEDAEECVNDTWYSIWNNIPPSRPQKLNLFLARIVRNISFDKYKSKNRKKRGAGEIAQVLDELEECIPTNQNIEDDYIAIELNETIQKFTRDLPEKEANVFIRRYFFVETFEEIGKRYNISSIHVGVILSRTRKKLKLLLEREGYSL